MREEEGKHRTDALPAGQPEHSETGAEMVRAKADRVPTGVQMAASWWRPRRVSSQPDGFLSLTNIMRASTSPDLASTLPSSLQHYILPLMSWIGWWSSRTSCGNRS